MNILQPLGKRLLHPNVNSLLTLCVIGWAFLIGCVAYPAWQQERAVSQIRRIGGDALYKSQVAYLPGDWVCGPALETLALKLGKRDAIRETLATWIGWDSVDSVGAVYLSGRRVPREVFVALGNLRGLEYIDLSGADFNTEDLRFLARCRCLKYLYLNSTRCAARDLSIVEDMSSLEEVALRDTSVGDSGLTSLGRAHSLRRLWIDRTQVSSAGLARLKWCANLEQLGLSGTDVNDSGLQHLSKLKRLRVLDVQCTDVTDAAVHDLAKALPNCRVFY